MDKRQKQVFRLVTLLPAFPAVASGTRGEQVLRLTAAGPLPLCTGFPVRPCGTCVSSTWPTPHLPVNGEKNLALATYCNN